MNYIWLSVQAQLLVREAAYIPANHPPWRQSVHRNPNIQCMVAVRDGMLVQRGEKKLTLNRGDFLFLQPKEPHQSWGPKNPSTGFYFAQFEAYPAPVWSATGLLLPSTDRQLVDPKQLVAPILGTVGPTDDEFFSLFSKLAEEWQAQRLYHQIRTNALLAQILVHIVRRQKKEASSYDHLKATSPTHATIVREVLDYVEEHLSESITAEGLCRNLNFSYQHLSRVFKAAVGMTIIEYVNRRRIAKAKALLATGQLSVAKVSDIVGFTDPYYFSRVFRRIEGISPREFIQQGYR